MLRLTDIRLEDGTLIPEIEADDGSDIVSERDMSGLIAVPVLSVSMFPTETPEISKVLQRSFLLSAFRISCQRLWLLMRKGS